MVILDRDLPSPELESAEENQKVSKKRRKGVKGPARDQMEAFSSTEMENRFLSPFPLSPAPASRALLSKSTKASESKDQRDKGAPQQLGETHLSQTGKGK